MDVPTGVGGATNAEYVPYHICGAEFPPAHGVPRHEPTIASSPSHPHGGLTCQGSICIATSSRRRTAINSRVSSAATVIDDLLGHMDRWEIDAAVISYGGPPLGDRPVAELTRMINEGYAELVHEHPTRFAAIASVPLPTGRRARGTGVRAGHTRARRRLAAHEPRGRLPRRPPPRCVLRRTRATGRLLLRPSGLPAVLAPSPPSRPLVRVPVRHHPRPRQSRIERDVDRSRMYECSGRTSAARSRSSPTGSKPVMADARRPCGYGARDQLLLRAPVARKGSPLTTAT